MSRNCSLSFGRFASHSALVLAPSMKRSLSRFDLGGEVLVDRLVALGGIGGGSAAGVMASRRRGNMRRVLVGRLV